MRVVVTGAANPYGGAIVEKLLAEGHQVRLFGVDEATAARFAEAQWHPGSLTTLGSIEPVLAEREALVHAAGLDAPSKDKHAHAIHIERSALSCRYGAERELLDHFIALTPVKSGRFSQSHVRAVATVEATRKVHTTVVTAADPVQAASDVLRALHEGPQMGRYPGRESDAVVP